MVHSNRPKVCEVPVDVAVDVCVDVWVQGTDDDAVLDWVVVAELDLLDVADAVAVVDPEVVAVDDAVVVRVDVADEEADDVAVVVCVDTSQRWNSSFATWLTNSLTTEAYISQLFATTNAPNLHEGVL